MENFDILKKKSQIEWRAAGLGIIDVEAVAHDRNKDPKFRSTLVDAYSPDLQTREKAIQQIQQMNETDQVIAYYLVADSEVTKLKKIKKLV